MFNNLEIKAGNGLSFENAFKLRGKINDNGYYGNDETYNVFDFPVMDCSECGCLPHLVTEYDDIPGHRGTSYMFFCPKCNKKGDFSENMARSVFGWNIKNRGMFQLPIFIGDDHELYSLEDSLRQGDFECNYKHYMMDHLEVKNHGIHRKFEWKDDTLPLRECCDEIPSISILVKKKKRVSSVEFKCDKCGFGTGIVYYRIFHDINVLIDLWNADGYVTLKKENLNE